MRHVDVDGSCFVDAFRRDGRRKFMARRARRIMKVHASIASYDEAQCNDSCDVPQVTIDGGVGMRNIGIVSVSDNTLPVLLQESIETTDEDEWTHVPEHQPSLYSRFVAWIWGTSA